MAFMNKVGNILKQSVGKYANSGLSASNSSIFQSIRCMSSSKLFVGGLSYGTDDTSLREAFASYGEVIEARVIMDRETGRSRGFGFVSFTSGEEASSAIQAMDGQDLHGRRVRVNYATDRAGGFRSGGGGYDGGGGYGGGGYGGGGYSGGGGGYGGGGYGGAGGGGYGGAGGGGSYGSDSYGSGGGSGGSGYNNSPGFGGGGYGTASSGGNYGVSGGGGGGDNYVSGGADNGAFATGGSYGGGSGSGGGGFGGSSDMSGGYGGSTGAPVQGNNQDDLSGELGGNDLDAATKSSFRDDDNDDEPNDYANKRA